MSSGLGENKAFLSAKGAPVPSMAAHISIGTLSIFRTINSLA